MRPPGARGEPLPGLVDAVLAVEAGLARGVEEGAEPDEIEHALTFETGRAIRLASVAGAEDTARGGRHEQHRVHGEVGGHGHRDDRSLRQAGARALEAVALVGRDQQPAVTGNDQRRPRPLEAVDGRPGQGRRRERAPAVARPQQSRCRARRRRWDRPPASGTAAGSRCLPSRTAAPRSRRSRPRGRAHRPRRPKPGGPVGAIARTPPRASRLTPLVRPLTRCQVPPQSPERHSPSLVPAKSVSVVTTGSRRSTAARASQTRPPEARAQDGEHERADAAHRLIGRRTDAAAGTTAPAPPGSRACRPRPS